MNRAFYIIVIPAIATTFGWVTFGWGWRLATIVTAAEIVAVTGAIVFLVRRQKTQKAGAGKVT